MVRLSKDINNEIDLDSISIVGTETPYTPPDNNKQLPKLSPSDLVEDEDSLRKIKTYMLKRFGVGVNDKYNDKQIVDMFVNKMRRYRAGQSVVTLGETAWLARASEDDRHAAANAYSAFDRLGNVFGDQNTLWEKIDGVGDYLRAAIIDPVNLVSFGAGRFIAGAGIKKAASMAQALALKEVEKQQVKHGREKALEMGQEVAKKYMDNAASLAPKKEIGTAAATDAAFSVGVDVAYQNGMINSMQQEEYSGLQTGLSALGALVGGGLSAATIAARKATKDSAITPATDVKEKFNAAKKAAMTRVGTGLKKSAAILVNDTLKVKAGKGHGTAKRVGLKGGVLERNFFTRFLFGNDDIKKGPIMAGFVENLHKHGVEYAGPRFDGDGFTNWLTDVIKGSGDIKAFGQVYKTYEDAFNFLGKADRDVLIPDYNKALKKHAKDLGIKPEQMLEEEKLEFFANRIAFLASDGAKFLQGLGTAAKRMRAKGGNLEVYADEIVEDLADPAADAFNKITNTVGYVQNLIIRNIVTHPGTTALNVTGWGAYSLLQSTTDVIKAVLYTPTLAIPALNKLDRDKKSSYLRGLVTNQVGKLRNLIDPATSIEALESYMSVRQKEMKSLMRYMAGGVEQVEAFKKQFGFDPRDNMIGLSAEKYTNFMQTVFAVKGQDVLTKSVEFFYNLDKGIRKKYGMSYNDFLKDEKNLFKNMRSDDYLKLEAEAVDNTLKSVFSKKYGQEGFGKINFTKPVEGFATIIEEFRKIPVVGLAMPFGQFFNNTVAFMYDFSPLGGGVNFLKFFNPKGTADTREKALEGMIKAGIGFSIVRGYAQKELQYMDEGLAWHEEREGLLFGVKGQTGAVRSRQYDYPYSAFKMAGRVAAHWAKDGKIPDELIGKDGIIYDQFLTGQMSRQLGTYETGIWNLLKATADGDWSMSQEQALKVVGNVTSQAVSGLTRPLEPLNIAVAMARPDKYEAVNRREGNKVFNESIRYVEDIAKGLGLELSPKKYKASTDEDARVQVGKLVGYREVPKHSYIERMFNSIGRPNWRTGFYSSSPEADNRLNQVIFKYLEDEAVRVFKTGQFEKQSLNMRVKMVGEIVKRATELSKRQLKISPLLQDRRMEMMFKISKNRSKWDVSKYLKAFTRTGDMSDLTIEQLMLLDQLITQDSKAAKKLIMD